MARENGISREAQDAFALRSHRLAVAASDDGRLGAEIMRLYLPPEAERSVAEDNGIRRDSSLIALAKLPPVFDRRWGTLTAGNSSPLTDGAAALLLMSEERMRALGYAALAFIRSYAFCGVDPFGQLLIGPAIAIPKALDRAGLSLGDVHLIELHEAFAAQVLSVIQALGSDVFAREKLNRSTAVGEVDLDRTNVMGGSIAIGHPFGATGARLTLTLANALRRRGGGLGLIGVCAAGGLGFAMLLESE
jgi:acetyl-CoA acyltransferase